MAKAELYKNPPSQPFVTLTLTKEEVQMILDLVGNTPGDPAYEVYKAITNVTKLVYQSTYNVTKPKQ